MVDRVGNRLGFQIRMEGVRRGFSLVAIALVIVLVLVGCASPTSAGAASPHIVMIVVDDLGWDDTFRAADIHTPAIDNLVANGVVLDQYYVQAVCSPSRASFQTGRYAMHHGIVDWIPDDAAYGLPLNETTLGQKLKEVGYVTRWVGKWHLGFYKQEFTPTFRGFDSFKGFYSGGEDYFTHMSGSAYDFRVDNGPNCGKGCSKVASEDHGRYSTNVFAEEAVSIIRAHDKTKPLFLMLAFQGVHAPAMAPSEYIEPYAKTISDKKRRTFAGMVSAVDQGIANVTQALRDNSMADNTLIVFTSDNGGPTTTSDGVGARNWPLRGGKHAVFEGGVRATGVVSGPSSILKSRGTYQGLMHGADWFATLGEVAGFDTRNGTLPLDSVSQWTSLNMMSESPRDVVVLGNSTNTCSWKVGDARRVRYDRLWGSDGDKGCGFAIRKNIADHGWKLIQGYGGSPDQACNSTSTGAVCFEEPPRPSECPHGFCLYDVVADPDEHKEISHDHPDVVRQMTEEMDKLLRSYSEYQEDTSCPAHKFGKDPVVGDVWEPWC